MDSSLLSPNVSALLHRLGQAHERQLKEQRLEQAASTASAAAAVGKGREGSPPTIITANTTAKGNGNGNSNAASSDLRSLEQIEDAKMDSQRKRLGNLYLKQAADAKLQKAYMKQLNAELEKIYTQNEALASDPSFSVARKYDLYKDPNALFAKEFPEGVAPVTSDQLEALLGAAKAEEEVLQQVGGGEGGSSSSPTAIAEEASSAATGATSGGDDTPSSSQVMTPFQEALRDRLARAQRLVTEAKEGPPQPAQQPEAVTGAASAEPAAADDARVGEDVDGDDDPSLPPLPPPDEVERMLLEQRKAREARLAELKRQLEALGINSSIIAVGMGMIALRLTVEVCIVKLPPALNNVLQPVDVVHPLLLGRGHLRLEHL